MGDGKDNQFPPCVRCGYCCKKATCVAGQHFGADLLGCKFLVGDAPGNYSCQLVEWHPELAGVRDLAIGAGCCSTLNSDRLLAIRAKRSFQKIRE